jgi:hypothetical protein
MYFFVNTYISYVANKSSINKHVHEPAALQSLPIHTRPAWWVIARVIHMEGLCPSSGGKADDDNEAYKSLYCMSALTATQTSKTIANLPSLIVIPI